MTLLYDTSTDRFEPTLACPQCGNDETLRVYGPMGGPHSYRVTITPSSLSCDFDDLGKAPGIDEVTGVFCAGCMWDTFEAGWLDRLTPTEPAR